MDGIFYVLRAGCPWRDLAERYGPYTTCYNRWAKRGVWKAIFDRLAVRSRDSLHPIAGTIVKAHRAAGGAKGGRWRKLSAAHAAVGRRKSMPWSAGWGGR